MRLKHGLKGQSGSPMRGGLMKGLSGWVCSQRGKGSPGKNYILSFCLQPLVFLTVSVSFTPTFSSKIYSNKNIILNLILVCAHIAFLIL